MLLEPGCKVLVVHRRLFENDKSRYFIGSVDCYEDGVARVSGHTWVQDTLNGKFVKKEDVRTKVIPLSSLGLITYFLPGFVQLANLKFEFSESGSLWLRDDGEFRMDLSEGCR